MGNEYKSLWDEALTTLKTRLSPSEIEMYFQDINFVSSTENTITLATKSTFLKNQIINRYNKTIVDTLEQLSNRKLFVEYILQEEVSTKTNSSVNSNTSSNTSSNDSDSDLAGQTKAGHTNSPKQNSYKKENLNQEFIKDKQLNPKYVFDTFIIGDSNSFAANAAKAVAINPGTNYNPLLMYGGVGLGKTHLLQAIGNEALNLKANTKVVYVTSEQFLNEFVTGVLIDKDPYAFKNKYRKADILLIDDIHFLQNKEGIQEELFHTFNALYDSNKQIVFTCDRPVSELKNLTDRLRNRFTRGLNIDLQPPQLETRIAILRQMVENEDVDISDDVIMLISENINTNIRDLESALTKLIAYAKLINKKITVEVAEDQLNDFFTTPKQQNLTIDTIITVAADYFNFTKQDIKGKKRNQTISRARHIAIYIAKELTEHSTTEIAAEFGGRDHSTVIHSCDRIRALKLTDSTIDVAINEIKKRINEKFN